MADGLLKTRLPHPEKELRPGVRLHDLTANAAVFQTARDPPLALPRAKYAAVLVVQYAAVTYE